MLIQGFKCRCSPVLFSEGETWIHGRDAGPFHPEHSRVLRNCLRGWWLHSPPQHGSLQGLDIHGGIAHTPIAHTPFLFFWGESTEVSRFFSFFTKPREIVRSVTSIVLLHLCLIYLKFWVLVISLPLTSTNSCLLGWFGILSVELNNETTLYV